MATSPVTEMYRPPGAMDEGNVPYFEINKDLAAGQSAAVEEVLEAFQGLEAQIHAVVDSIEHNLNEMDLLLGMEHAVGSSGATHHPSMRFRDVCRST